MSPKTLTSYSWIESLRLAWSHITGTCQNHSRQWLSLRICGRKEKRYKGPEPYISDMCGRPKFPPEYPHQAMKAHRASVEEYACIFKICNSKSRFYFTDEISRENFCSTCKQLFSPGGGGEHLSVMWTELNSGSKGILTRLAKENKIYWIYILSLCVHGEKTSENESGRQYDYFPEEKQTKCLEYFKEF
jgi:hypothetical protein